MQQAHVIRSAILLALAGALALLAVGRLRAYKLKERYAIVFLALALPFVVLAVFPRSIEWISTALGISYFTVMLLCVSAFLFLIVFELLSIVSQQDGRITTLAQMVGILNQRQAEQERAMRDLRDRRAYETARESTVGSASTDDLNGFTAASADDLRGYDPTSLDDLHGYNPTSTDDLHG